MRPLATLRRLFHAWQRLRRLSDGEPGQRCGGCGATPPPGERLCFDCWASHAAAP